jgi:hypothetical protein
LGPSTPKRVPKESYITDGAYPCIDQGKDFIGGYTNDEEAIVRRLPAIVFGDHTRVLKYVSEPFACGADGTQLLYAKDGVLTQSYLYCALKEIDLTNYFYARHFKILKSKEVFVPPYSIVKQFTDEVSCNFELISVLRKHGVKLAAARDMLLPRLMKEKWYDLPNLHIQRAARICEGAQGACGVHPQSGGVMSQKISIRFYNDREVRAVWDDAASKWWFSVLDIVAAINREPDYAKTRNYWKWLKAKLRREDSQLVSATTQRSELT